MGIPSFFIRPNLKIYCQSYQSGGDRRIRDKFTPVKTLYSQEGDLTIGGQVIQRPVVQRRMFRAWVRNEPRLFHRFGATAYGCEGSLTVIHSRTNCGGPTTEKRLLRWESGQLGETIPARTGDKKLELIFADKGRASGIKKSDCTVNPESNSHTFISSLDSIVRSPGMPDDAFCQGEFEIHVKVISEKGYFDQKYYLLTVGEDWEHVSMKELKKKELTTPSE